MIEKPPVLKVYNGFSRPPASVLEALAGLPTGFIVDCMDGRGALDPEIKPLNPEKDRFIGTAVPCYCGPNDNLAVFGALHMARENDVIIAAADGFSRAAVTGDLLLGMCRNKGAVAFVTDGMVRDIEGCRNIGLPIFAAGITPNSPVGQGPGTAGLPITIAGVSVSAGDIVMGDLDGVVILPAGQVDAVLSRLETVKKLEAEMEAKVEAGLQVPDWVDELMNSDAVQRIDSL